MAKRNVPTTKNWKRFWRGLSWTAAGTIFLGILGFIADTTGILGYVGINLLPATPPSSSVVIGGNADGNTIIQSGGGDVNLIQPTNSSEIEVANQVLICMKQHNLPKAHFSTENYETNDKNLIAILYFYFCDWPPPIYASLDGYTEIKVETVPGPDYSSGKGMAEIEAPIIDRVYSTCNELKLGYEMGMQGVGGPLMPFAAIPDSIVDVTGKPWEFNAETSSFGIAGYLGFYPERNELVVIHPAYGFNLDSVECIR